MSAKGTAMNIGWIGLGMIGTAMVKRLLAKDFAVTVFRRGKGLDEVLAAGSRSTSDYLALAAASDILILCVYNDTQVRDVLFEKGTLAAMRSGSVVVIHTTGSPELMREIQRTAPANVSILDATFSGGPHDVEAGRLIIMAGGDDEALQRIKPVLDAYARQVTPVGELGRGQIIKLLNNLLFAANLMNAAQVLKLAAEQGFDTSAAASIIGECSGASYAMARFQAPMPMDTLLAMVRPYLEKDVSTAMSIAAANGLDVTAFNPVAQYFSGSN